MSNFTTPTLVAGKNSGSSVNTTNKVVGVNVPAATPLTIGITTTADTTTVTSVVDSKSNTWKLVGVQTTTVNRPITIYKCWVTTPLVSGVDTITVNTSANTIINFICVATAGIVEVPTAIFGSFSTSSVTAADVPVTSLLVDAETVISFENNGSATPSWTSPAVAIDTESGGGGPFFTASYTPADRNGADPATTWGVASTWSMASVGTMDNYTDLYTDAYSSLYGQFAGTTWPSTGAALQITIAIMVNGTLTDITEFAYQRDGSVQIDIDHGRQNESSKFTYSTMGFQLNNRDGRFSSKNTAGPYYPYLTRNVQIMCAVQYNTNGIDSGYIGQFWGEVAAWPASWDPTGNDIWVNVTASGMSRRLQQQGPIGSAIKRYYIQKGTSDPTYPISYWPCEDGSTSTQIAEITGAGQAGTFTGTPTLASDSSFGGSDPIPVLNGAVITLNTASFNDSGLALYQTPGTYTFSPRAGLTTLSTVEAWGGGGGGTNGYNANGNKDAAGGGSEYAKDTSVAVSGATSYTVTVGAGGAGGVISSNGSLAKNKANPGKDGGSSKFVGDSVTTTAHGGKGGTFTGSRGGNGGTGSTSATHHDGGAGGKNSGTSFGGSGGGGSGGTSATGNSGANGGGSNTGAAGGVAVAGGGAGGKGGNGGASVDQGGTIGAFPGGGGGSGGENSNNQAAHGGANGSAGQVKLTWTPLTIPSVNNVRFICGIPNSGDVNNTVLLRFISGGTVVTTDVVYTTAASGSLTILGKDSGGTQLFTSAGSITGVNGKDMFISAELMNNGTGGVGFAIRVLNINNLGSGSGQTAGTAAVTGTIGPVSQIILNPGGLGTAYSAGHITLQYNNEDWAKINNDPIANVGPISGWNGERAADRFTRLCTEQGIAYELKGNRLDTAHMGPQPDDNIINVLQQIEDFDRGFLYEPTVFAGLGYRTYTNMVGKTPLLIADYSKGQISPPFLPTEDDFLTRNKVTVSRTNGSSVVAQLTTGSMSTQDPPNGVGEYDFSITVNAFQDSDLSQVATRILNLGTVDDYRYPNVTFDLTRSAVAGLFATLNAMREGDYMQILNPLAPVINGTVKQITVGFILEISARKFVITFNCIPETAFV